MYSLSPHHDENCWHQAPPVDSKKKHHTTNHLSPSYDLHQTEHDETRGQKAPPSGSEKKHQTVLLFPTSYLWRVDGRVSVFSSQPHPSLSQFTFTFHFFLLSFISTCWSQTTWRGGRLHWKLVKYMFQNLSMWGSFVQCNRKDTSRELWITLFVLELKYM